MEHGHKKKEQMRLWTESPLPTLVTKYKGMWDMQDLYESIVDWFKHRKFNFYEIVNERKRTTHFGSEEKYLWQGRRKENDYVEYVIDVQCRLYDAREVQMVMPDGTTKTFTKGRLWLQFDNKTIFDWEHKWEKTPFFAELRNFYHKYFLRNWNEYIWTAKVYEEMRALHDFVQKKLKMVAA